MIKVMKCHIWTSVWALFYKRGSVCVCFMTADERLWWVKRDVIVTIQPRSIVSQRNRFSGTEHASSRPYHHWNSSQVSTQPGLYFRDDDGWMIGKETVERSARVSNPQESVQKYWLCGSNYHRKLENISKLLFLMETFRWWEKKVVQTLSGWSCRRHKRNCRSSPKITVDAIRFGSCIACWAQNSRLIHIPAMPLTFSTISPLALPPPPSWRRYERCAGQFLFNEFHQVHLRHQT